MAGWESSLGDGGARHRAAEAAHQHRRRDDRDDDRSEDGREELPLQSTHGQRALGRPDPTPGHLAREGASRIGRPPGRPELPAGGRLRGEWIESSRLDAVQGGQPKSLKELQLPESELQFGDS